LRKVLAVLTVLFVICVSGAAFAAEPIKIGYLAALTGDFAAYGITEVNMAKLVVGDVNAKGGVLGRPLELVVYDTKTRNEDAVNAVRRMIESDKVVAIVGANSSGINIATAPIVNKGRSPRYPRSAPTRLSLSTTKATCAHILSAYASLTLTRAPLRPIWL